MENRLSTGADKENDVPASTQVNGKNASKRKASSESGKPSYPCLHLRLYSLGCSGAVELSRNATEHAPEAPE